MKVKGCNSFSTDGFIAGDEYCCLGAIMIRDGKD
jgi:hypothetical protein